MRVLAATAIALLVIMVSRSCVGYPNQDAIPEQETQFELEDNEDVDLINIQDEDEPADQLTRVDSEVADSSTFQPTYFEFACQVKKNVGTCESYVKFMAMGKTFSMKVKVLTYYYSSSNRLLFYLYVNGKYRGHQYLSAAEDSPQTFCKVYSVSGGPFDVCVVASRMYSDMNHSGTRSCSRVFIKASNKIWARTRQRCVRFH